MERIGEGSPGLGWSHESILLGKQKRFETILVTFIGYVNDFFEINCDNVTRIQSLPDYIHSK